MADENKKAQKKAEKELEKAKKDNNTYMIRMIGDLIGQIAGAAGSVGVGYGAVSKALKK